MSRARRIAVAYLAIIGAAALVSLVLLVTMPAAAMAGSVGEGIGARASADSPCGQGVIAPGAWVTCTAMPTGRSGAAAAAVGDTIYVIGGSESFSAMTTTEAYDTVSDTWASVKSLPTARNGLAAAAQDGLVYAIGGWTTVFVSPTAVVEVYDPISNTWTTVAPLPAPRGDLAAVALGGKVYAIGGSDGLQTVTNTVMAYDPVTGTWEPRAPMLTSRSGLAAVVVDGTIYAIGGTDGTSPTAAVEAYNPSSDTWSVRASMPFSRSSLAAAVLDGKVYVVGGTESGFFPQSSLATNQEYDPVEGSWQTVTPMPTARSGLVAVTVDGRLFAIGGGSDGLESVSANEAYSGPAPYQVYVPLMLRAFAP